MDIALILLLFLAAAIVGWYDTYSVQRTYADRCAARHGHIPPLIDWFFQPDPDAEVERWRRRHRDMYLLTCVLVVAAVIVALVRATTQG
jgi:hypothetical protein